MVLFSDANLTTEIQKITKGEDFYAFLQIKDLNDESFSDFDDDFLKELIYCYIYVNEFNNYFSDCSCFVDFQYFKK